MNSTDKRMVRHEDLKRVERPLLVHRPSEVERHPVIDGGRIGCEVHECQPTK